MIDVEKLKNLLPLIEKLRRSGDEVHLKITETEVELSITQPPLDRFMPAQPRYVEPFPFMERQHPFKVQY